MNRLPVEWMNEETNEKYYFLKEYTFFTGIFNKYF